jgi:hypothetical protein
MLAPSSSSSSRSLSRTVLCRSDHGGADVRERLDAIVDELRRGRVVVCAWYVVAVHELCRNRRSCVAHAACYRRHERQLHP